MVCMVCMYSMYVCIYGIYMYMVCMVCMVNIFEQTHTQTYTNIQTSTQTDMQTSTNIYKHTYKYIGSNSYKKGTEVFNSYGRRPNDNLLLDYGFSILDNEWDELSLSISLSSMANDFEIKTRALFAMGYGRSVTYDNTPFVVCLTFL